MRGPSHEVIARGCSIKRAAAAAILGVIGVASAGCEGESKAAVQLEIIFPSTAMAVAADALRFVVYDDPSPGACQRIYLKRITNQQNVPPVVLETSPVSVCTLALHGPDPIDLPLGKFSILAIASRGSDDILVGCTDVALSSEGGEAAIHLALPGATPVPPPTSCSSLRDFCEFRCD